MVGDRSTGGENAVGVACPVGGRGDRACGCVRHLRRVARKDAGGEAIARGQGRDGAGSRIGHGCVGVEGVDACGLARACGRSRNGPAVGHAGRAAAIDAVADTCAASAIAGGRDDSGVGGHRGVGDRIDAISVAAAIGRSRNRVGVRDRRGAQGLDAKGRAGPGVGHGDGPGVGERPRAAGLDRDGAACSGERGRQGACVGRRKSRVRPHRIGIVAAAGRSRDACLGIIVQGPVGPRVKAPGDARGRRC